MIKKTSNSKQLDSNSAFWIFLGLGLFGCGLFRIWCFGFRILIRDCRWYRMFRRFSFACNRDHRILVRCGARRPWFGGTGRCGVDGAGKILSYGARTDDSCRSQTGARISPVTHTRRALTADGGSGKADERSSQSGPGRSLYCDCPQNELIQEAFLSLPTTMIIATSRLWATPLKSG